MLSGMPSGMPPRGAMGTAGTAGTAGEQRVRLWKGAPPPPLRPVFSGHLRRAPKGGVRHHITGRHYAGGQFLPRALWLSERRRAEAALPDLVAEFGEGMQFLRVVYEQQAALRRAGITAVAPIPYTTVEARMKAAIRSAYARAFLLGKRASGNLAAATEPEQSLVQRLSRGEYPYLRAFLAAMREGDGRMPYPERMACYANALREAYWAGFVGGDTSPSRRLRWVLGPTEASCASCAGMARLGALPASEMQARVERTGFLPQSGSLACHGIHCRCRIVEAGTAGEGDAVGGGDAPEG